jgi:hypothetical protein
MGDQLLGTLGLAWVAALLAVLAIAWGLTRWFRWRSTVLERLLE